MLATPEYPLLYALVAAQGEAAALMRDPQDERPRAPPPSRRHVEHCLQHGDEWPGCAAFIAHLFNIRQCLDALYLCHATRPDTAISDWNSTREQQCAALMRSLHDCRDSLRQTGPA